MSTAASSARLPRLQPRPPLLANIAASIPLESQPRTSGQQARPMSQSLRKRTGSAALPAGPRSAVYVLENCRGHSVGIGWLAAGTVGRAGGGRDGGLDRVVAGRG